MNDKTVSIIVRVFIMFLSTVNFVSLKICYSKSGEPIVYTLYSTDVEPADQTCYPSSTITRDTALLLAPASQSQVDWCWVCWLKTLGIWYHICWGKGLDWKSK